MKQLHNEEFTISTFEEVRATGEIGVLLPIVRRIRIARREKEIEETRKKHEEVRKKKEEARKKQEEEERKARRERDRRRQAVP